jgi:amidase
MRRRAADGVFGDVDVLLLPTAGTVYEATAVAAEPLQLNSNLGLYTSFVNLLDLAAIALPAGFGGNGLPFGLSLIARPFGILHCSISGPGFNRWPVCRAAWSAPSSRMRKKSVLASSL